MGPCCILFSAGHRCSELSWMECSGFLAFTFFQAEIWIDWVDGLVCSCIHLVADWIFMDMVFVAVIVTEIWG